MGGCLDVPRHTGAPLSQAFGRANVAAMNVNPASTSFGNHIQAVDGVSRRLFTVNDYYRMGEVGIFKRGERIELIGGEIIAMSPAGRHHEVLRSELLIYWLRRCPPQLKVASESSLRLSDAYEPVPDLYIFPADLVTPDVRGDTVLLVVEIADSSLAYDSTTKATVYAAHGVREYWVIDAKMRTVTVHRRPEANEYAETFKVAAEETASPECAPELAVRLAELAGA